MDQTVEACQRPPSLSAGSDLWDASSPLGRHMVIGQQYALWRTTGRSLEEQQARADVMRETGDGTGRANARVFPLRGHQNARRSDLARL
jgi:hypothetical protein